MDNFSVLLTAIQNKNENDQEDHLDLNKCVTNLADFAYVAISSEPNSPNSIMKEKSYLFNTPNSKGRKKRKRKEYIKKKKVFNFKKTDIPMSSSTELIDHKKRKRKPKYDSDYEYNEKKLYVDTEETQNEEAFDKIDEFSELYSGKRIAWTKEDDEKLVKLVKDHHESNWTRIAAQMPGHRFGKQCRERWHNHLDSQVKKGGWTQEEDKLIFNQHQLLGNQWAEIANNPGLKGRTDNAIKNRVYSALRRLVRSYCRHLEEQYNNGIGGLRAEHVLQAKDFSLQAIASDTLKITDLKTGTSAFYFSPK